MAAAQRLQKSLRIPVWQADPSLSVAALKADLARHRREVIFPAIQSAHGSHAVNPPLPWAWIAANAEITFRQEAFTIWWQVRVLGKAYPSHTCPWCTPQAQTTREHLQQECATFAACCWTKGVRPEEAFTFPPDPEWFTAALLAIEELLTATALRSQLAQLPECESERARAD